MKETVNERVSILASFNYGPKGIVVILPHVMRWKGRRYQLDKFGLYHPERRGTKRVHIFSFTASGTSFRVELDPDSLEWTLTEVYYG